MMLMLMRVKCACRGSANEENEQQFWGRIWNHRWELLLGIIDGNYFWELVMAASSPDSILRLRSSTVGNNSWNRLRIQEVWAMAGGSASAYQQRGEGEGEYCHTVPTMRKITEIKQGKLCPIAGPVCNNKQTFLPLFICSALCAYNIVHTNRGQGGTKGANLDATCIPPTMRNK